MATMQDEIFAQPEIGWCDYNGGIPNKPAPPTKYIISLSNTKSQPFLGGDPQGAQYIKDIVNGSFVTTSYHDVTGIKQFNSIVEAVNWVESKGITFINSGLQVLID